MTLIIDDATPKGIRVRIERTIDSWQVWVNNQPDRVLRVDTYRDGGTKALRLTSGAIITLPHMMGRVDRVPKYNGEDIGPVPPEVTAERERQAQTFQNILRRESGR